MSRLVHLRFLFTFLITVLAYTAVAKLDKPSDVLIQGATSFCCKCAQLLPVHFSRKGHLLQVKQGFLQRSVPWYQSTPCNRISQSHSSKLPVGERSSNSAHSQGPVCQLHPVC